MHSKIVTFVISIVSNASWRKRSRLSTLAFCPEATPPPPDFAPQSLSMSAVFVLFVRSNALEALCCDGKVAKILKFSNKSCEIFEIFGFTHFHLLILSLLLLY